MSSTRKTALVAGVFYLITFVSIPTLALYGPVKDHRDWILSSGATDFSGPLRLIPAVLVWNSSFDAVRYRRAYQLIRAAPLG